MIRRFLEVEMDIAKILIDYTISINDSNILNEILDILNSLEVAIARLGNRETDLLISDRVFDFLIKKFDEMGTLLVMKYEKIYIW